MDTPDSRISHMGRWLALAAAAQTNAAAARLVQTIERHTEEEFYDTQTDPFELNNLIADPAHRERIALLRDKLAIWMKQQGDAGTPEAN